MNVDMQDLHRTPCPAAWVNKESACSPTFSFSLRSLNEDPSSEKVWRQDGGLRPSECRIVMPISGFGHEAKS